VLVSRDTALLYLNNHKHCNYLPHYHTELRGRKGMEKGTCPFRSNRDHSFLSCQVWFRLTQSMPNTGLVSEGMEFGVNVRFRWSSLLGEPFYETLFWLDRPIRLLLASHKIERIENTQRTRILLNGSTTKSGTSGNSAKTCHFVTAVVLPLCQEVASSWGQH
jgi:hypothetical protein